MDSSSSDFYDAYKYILTKIIKCDGIENLSSKDKRKMLKLLRENPLLDARQGPAGPTGPRGPQGLVGPQGPRGDCVDCNEIPNDIEKISNLKNANEYYDFVKSLQGLTTFPPEYMSESSVMPYYKHDKSGVYIINKLSSSSPSNEIQIRKMKLALALLKEEDNLNLSCWRFNQDNNFIRAVDNNTDKNRYNMLDREMCISSDVTLLREFMNTSQGNQSFWITVFPLHVKIAQLIFKNDTWNPIIKYNGSVRGVTSVTGLTPSDKGENANLILNVTYARLNPDNTQTGASSGIGLTKAALIVDKTYEAKPGCCCKLQTPLINYKEYDVDPVPLDTFMVFQVQYIASDQNIVLLTNNKDGELIVDSNVPVLFDDRESL